MWTIICEKLADVHYINLERYYRFYVDTGTKARAGLSKWHWILWNGTFAPLYHYKMATKHTCKSILLSSIILMAMKHLTLSGVSFLRPLLVPSLNQNFLFFDCFYFLLPACTTSQCVKRLVACLRSDKVSLQSTKNDKLEAKLAAAASKEHTCGLDSCSS